MVRVHSVSIEDFLALGVVQAQAYPYLSPGLRLRAHSCSRMLRSCRAANLAWVWSAVATDQTSFRCKGSTHLTVDSEDCGRWVEGKYWATLLR